MSAAMQEPTPESVWAFMQETARQMQETDRKMQETDRLIQENALQMKETDRKLEQAQELFTQQMKETDRRLKQGEGLFTSQWGRLVESLVEGALVPLLQEFGISIQRTLRRVRGCYKGKNYEFDILVVNGDELVIVEVKTTLRPKDVTRFVAKLDQCKVWMPEYASRMIYGGVAFIQADADAERMAEKQRLFVIEATGNSAVIVNQEGFRPRSW
uniref:DUF3782 domain-containing protein n=1 Tax=Candidatus Kentrum sp. FM TaxID=2126340 RepID=A0A450X4P8_9GAMM|nr:MAG: hypothetical protein BECKFM1743C_GA0114222_109751 [Candidatus Kentron sp. FM]VFJ77427.1 MAG: hypothetical protein BECKFM1743A_GA0114220_109831 [Candidatus Kentron sp. FM]VFK24266.1 MAG: hypothetical protein BECKFM1743B_GA0114221_109791 [Candidatus Kentron sp. FM]